MNQPTHRLRLLIVLPDAAMGGGHLMNFRLAAMLVARGWRVDIAMLFNRQRNDFYRETFPTVTQIFLDGDNFAGRLLLPFHLVRLAKDYDIVMAGLDLAATNYGFVASMIARKPFLAWMHIAFNEHMQTTSWLDRKLSLIIYRKLRHIIFPSTGARSSLEKAVGGKPKGAVWNVIENFNSEARSVTAIDTSLPDIVFELPVVLSIGRLAPQKMFGRLLRTHAALKKLGLKHHLVILGEGPQREQLEADIVRLEVSETVFLPGHVSNPQAWLRRATVFALCSDYEGLPLVLIEALQEGLPIVSMDCPAGPREILQEGAVGLLTPKGDERAFQSALAKLLQSPKLRAEYARLGRERGEFYSADRVIPLWEGLLTQIENANAG